MEFPPSSFLHSTPPPKKNNPGVTSPPRLPLRINSGLTAVANRAPPKGGENPTSVHRSNFPAHVSPPLRAPGGSPNKDPPTVDPPFSVPTCVRRGLHGSCRSQPPAAGSLSGSGPPRLPPPRSLIWSRDAHAPPRTSLPRRHGHAGPAPPSLPPRPGSAHRARQKGPCGEREEGKRAGGDGEVLI